VNNLRRCYVPASYQRRSRGNAAKDIRAALARGLARLPPPGRSSRATLASRPSRSSMSDSPAHAGPPRPDGQSALSWRPAAPSAGPGLRRVFFRSDVGPGLPSPSDDGGFEEFSEFCFTCAARSATCACESAICASIWPIRASRSASSSRSRAFAARSRAHLANLSQLTGHRRGVPDTRCTTPEPALSDPHDTPSRPQATRRSSARPQIRRQPSLRTQVDRDLLAQPPGEL
jgi:hypothetical protein